MLGRAKCKVCKKSIRQTDLDNNGAIVLNYKGSNMYFCCEEHCGKHMRELKKTELYYNQRDDIDRYVKENIFFYKDGQKLPSSFYDRIADLHNGTDRCKQNKDIRNGERMGYPMPVILETLKSQRETILYWFRSKSFRNEAQKLNYMWRIVEGNINDEYEKWERNLRQEARKEATSIDQDVVDRIFNNDKVTPTPSPTSERTDLSWVLEHFDD